MCVIQYLSYELGYIWFSRFYNNGNYVYNSKLLTDKTFPIIELLKSNIGFESSDALEYKKFSDKKIKQCKKNMKRMQVNYENR